MASLWQLWWSGGGGGSGSSGGVAGAGRSGGVNSRGGHRGAEPQRLNLMAGRGSGCDAGPVDGSGDLGTSAALGAEVLTKVGACALRAAGFRGRGTEGGSSRGAAVVIFLNRRRMLGLPRPDRPPVPAGWDSARVAGLQEQAAQAESASKKNDGIAGEMTGKGVVVVRFVGILVTRRAHLVSRHGNSAEREEDCLQHGPSSLAQLLAPSSSSVK